MAHRITLAADGDYGLFLDSDTGNIYVARADTIVCTFGSGGITAAMTPTTVAATGAVSGTTGTFTGALSAPSVAHATAATGFLLGHNRETVATTVTPVATAATLDFANGNIQTLDLGSASGTVILTMSNAVAGGVYIVKVIQGATERAITWPAAAKWNAATAPTLTAANDAVDLFRFHGIGTDLLGEIVAQALA